MGESKAQKGKENRKGESNECEIQEGSQEGANSIGRWRSVDPWASSSGGDLIHKTCESLRS